MAPILSKLALLAIAFSGQVLAHPGHDIELEIKERADFLASPQYRSLDHCRDAIKARDEKLIQRRMEIVNHQRQKRGLEARSFEDVLNTDHHSSLAVTPDSPFEAIFGSNHSCILQAETTEGPYYVSGELVRSDITDDEPGVPLIFDILLIDTNTCEAIPDVALEAWYANSTGVYGGVVAGGNGNSNDQSNVDNTMLRGIQFSDDDGVVQFEGVFPGHYTGRAIHMHILAHIGATTIANGTITGGHVSHVGQLFFDQTLIDQVEKTSPYSTNKQTLTQNSRDGIFSQEAANSDPVLNYVLLGSTVSSGIFGWVTVGIDPNVVKTVRPAGHYDGPN